MAALLPTARANIAGNALLGPVCDRAEGIATAEAGHRGEAAGLLRAARAGFDTLKVPFETARTLEDLAAIGSDRGARPALEAALATYDRLGARPHSDAVRSRLQPGIC